MSSGYSSRSMRRKSLDRTAWSGSPNLALVTFSPSFTVRQGLGAPDSSRPADPDAAQSPVAGKATLMAIRSRSPQRQGNGGTVITR